MPGGHSQAKPKRAASKPKAKTPAKPRPVGGGAKPRSTYTGGANKKRKLSNPSVDDDLRDFIEADDSDDEDFEPGDGGGWGGSSKKRKRSSGGGGGVGRRERKMVLAGVVAEEEEDIEFEVLGEGDGI